MTYTTWGEIAKYAADSGAKFPELVAAQWALESGWGSKVSGKNNFFGIKGTPGTECVTTEYINGKETAIKDTFKDFENAQECVEWLVSRWYKDYANLKTGQKFNGVNRASNRDHAAQLLIDEGYATDPDYRNKLVKLMNTNSIPQTQSSKVPRFISLVDAARWFSGKPHQIKALMELERTLTDEQLRLFAENYRRTSMSQQSFPLDVPYFYQRDSKTGHGERSCQSSAIAMVIEYINPTLISDDDEYLKTVFRYGDTISQAAHNRALDSLGLKHQFSTNGSESKVLSILDKGYPVPIGVLHRGSLSNPSGGGHWITLIGYDENNFHVHDPFGEMDLVNGGYIKTGSMDGKNKRYSRKNLLKRWLISSSSDGWYWDLSQNVKV